METEKHKRLLTFAQVRQRIPYTRQHLGRLEKAGLFPKRVQLGPNRVAWIETEIDEHIEAVAARRAA
jgi:prophage regulatory protein